MGNGKTPEDDAQRVVTAAYEDASDAAGAEAGTPRAAAHRLTAVGLALCDTLDGAALDGVVLASQDGEPAPDTARIQTMDHAELVAFVAQLRVMRGEPVDSGLLAASQVEELRALARVLRSSFR